MQPLNFSTEMNEIRSGVAGRHETKLTMGLNYIRRCLAASRKVNGARARSGSSAFYFFFAGAVFAFGLGVALGFGFGLVATVNSLL